MTVNKYNRDNYYKGKVITQVREGQGVRNSIVAQVMNDSAGEGRQALVAVKLVLRGRAEPSFLPQTCRRIHCQLGLPCSFRV